MAFHPLVRCRTTLARASIATLALAAAMPSGASAQRKRETQEFTRQGLLIAHFSPGAGVDMKTARRAADAVRSRIAKLINSREVDVIDGGEIAWRFEKAGYDPDTTPTASDIRAIGKDLRADEYVLASVSKNANAFTIRAELVLFRDERLRQPLPEATAARLDSAATLVARSLSAARAQLVPERRCENALRDGSATRAAAAAREGIAAYRRSAIARTCLVWALKGNAPPAEVLGVATELLDIDANNPHGLEAAAVSLDSLRRRDDAARHWLRLAATDTGALELSWRVSFALLEGGNAKHAEPFLLGLSRAHPEDIRFSRLLWRAAYEMKDWSVAIGAGEILIERDTIARGDSSFFYRLGLAYREFNKPFKAIETLARGVSLFPADAKLYSLYAQYIKAEADTVVPRGVALFPQNADLLALNGKELRARGKIAESLEATKRAVALDTAMSQGQLMVAQLEIELGRPDSALVALHRAIATGQDSGLVAQFALAKGNTLYRAANGTKTSADFSIAVRLLAFSDSVRASEQARFLTGAAALGVAQAAFTEASKAPDKTEGCRLTKVGFEMLPVARNGLKSGEQSFAEAAKQSLEYLDQLEPFAQQQMKIACPEPSPLR